VQVGGLRYVVENVMDEGSGGVYQETQCAVLDTWTLQIAERCPAGQPRPAVPT